METIRIEVGAEGVAVWTIDVPGETQNVINSAFHSDLIAAVENLADAKAVRGVIITSGKPTGFMAGADVKGVELLANSTDPYSQKEPITRFKAAMRALEQAGMPIVALLNGHALGGGYELALACHHRIAVDDPATRIGLPEVTLGLLPGGGGTQRLLRLIGIEAAIEPLVRGTIYAPADALARGMVDDVVPADAGLDAARAWITANPDARQPWDRKNFAVPGGLPSAGSPLAGQFVAHNALIQRETLGNYPAPRAILSCLFEGATLPMDRALELETQYFLSLVADPVAGNMVRTSFLNRKAAERLRARPDGVERGTFAKVGVIGAGLMGSGIAQSAAAAGLEVLLLDRDRDAAQRGKDGIAKTLERLVAKNILSAADCAAQLSRIRPECDFAALSGADIVIEAVFEDPQIKTDVLRQAEAHLKTDALLCSNTSTLPITSLADGLARPDQFAGLHFFWPVPRMALVEIIVGDRTSDKALAHALDFVRKLRKTPIVVRDSRGFYTSRAFGTFADEAFAMVAEGVSPALIENGARFAGMPMAPLALADDISLALYWSVVEANRNAAGAAYRPTAGEETIDMMANRLARPGRAKGSGFYEYAGDGSRRLWPGLMEAFPPADSQPDLSEIKRRLLYRQALEAARCVEENIVGAADADLGAVLGWGFPAYTGGPLSLINMIGTERFVAECDTLATRHGERFAPPQSLRDRIDSGSAAAA